nr:lipase 3-like [Leptinotarsa decemlineata]
MRIALLSSLVAILAGIGYGSVLNSATGNLLDASSKVLNPAKNILNITSNILDPKDSNSDKKHIDRVPEMVAKNGYPVESHYVTTWDGYILNLHRIPHGKGSKKNNGKVVLLQHGLLASSTDWVIAGPGKGLGYILADEGYDVWLGNARGNFFSRNHTTMNPDKESEFWDFSWHEIGMRDLPMMIDYIIDKTGVDGIYYAGHSQGTTAFYIMASSKPEYNQKVKVHVSLAPIAFMNHMTSPLVRVIAAGERSISVLMDLIGKDEFLPKSGFMSMLSSAICSGEIGALLCSNALFAVCGFSPKQMNVSLIPELVQHYPAGVATKQVLHYAQEINSGRFCQYNLGLIGNTRKYGSMVPPDYNLDEIKTPIHLIYSQNDWMAAVTDVERLAKALGSCLKEKILVTDPKWNHLDFTFGIDAPRLVYKKVQEIFEKY